MRRLLVLVALVPIGVSGSAVAALDAGPPKLRLTAQCVTKAERKRVVRFRAADGIRLIGVELGSGRRGVVLAHSHRQSLCEWLPHARRLARGGYRVLVFDHRNHGSSSYPRSGFLSVDRDVVGAVRTIRARGARTVVLAGSSMGATAVLAGAAALKVPVDGVVSLSAPAQFSRVDAGAAVRTLAIPTVFVAGEQDDPFDDDALTLFNESAAREKRLEVVPASPAHGTRLLGFQSVRALFDEFLRDHS